MVDSYSKTKVAAPTCSGEGQEFKRLRDKHFNNYRPMVPQGKVWRVKALDQPARSVEPPQATGLTGTSIRSDRPEQPVRPVEVAAEQKAELELPVSVLCDGETPLAFLVQGNEELVEHETTPKVQRYGAQRHLSAWGGGKILVNDNLPHEVSMQ